MKHFDNCQVRVVPDSLLFSANYRDSCVPKVELDMQHDERKGTMTLEPDYSLDHMQISYLRQFISANRHNNT